MNQLARDKEGRQRLSVVANQVVKKDQREFVHGGQELELLDADDVGILEEQDMLLLGDLEDVTDEVTVLGNNL